MSELPDLAPIALEPLPDRPLVSVLMANFNYAEYLGSAVRSVLAQTYDALELIVCDDGSTDDSRAVLRELARSDPRLRALTQANAGQAAAWNRAHREARGSIVAFLDADDAFAPEKLGEVVRAFRERPQVGFVYHRYQRVDADGRPVGPPAPSRLEQGWLAGRALRQGAAGIGALTSSMALRRELADLLFPLPVELRFGDAYLQGLAQLLVEIAALPEALTSYRLHGANDSGALAPTAETVRVLLAARRRVFPHMQAFVAECFGTATAAALALEDNPSYWEYVAASYVLAGRPAEGVHGHSAAEVLASPSLPRKRAWSVLFALPTGLAVRSLRLWWGHSAAKQAFRTLRSLLGGVRSARAARWQGRA